MYTDILRDQKTSDSLELELKVVVLGLIWVLGTEPGYSVSALSALNQGTISRTLFPNKNDFMLF